eukprot:gnl/Chilomastix_caulleri/1182.p1 GENE.gnl/Chilomastix_caulleri/1182~~gnl/Chilomastix_caulleri/1182.p1  ORF type:complete len:288 (+),score=106.45 gnl/Chilomastix_caulleri/1182:108-971(+)
MYSSDYDYDITIYSPQGRVHQIEYAMESLKLGSITVGVRSKTEVVIAAIKKETDVLTDPQPKIFKIDDHIGIAIDGLAADARILRRFLRDECADYRYSNDAPHPLGRLSAKLTEDAQQRTMLYGHRPYGAGLLIAGYDQAGPHLIQFVPSGMCGEYFGAALGPRAQTARVALERASESLPDLNRDELILTALAALGRARGASILTAGSVEVGICCPFEKEEENSADNVNIDKPAGDNADKKNKKISDTHRKDYGQFITLSVEEISVYLVQLKEQQPQLFEDEMDDVD